MILARCFFALIVSACFSCVCVAEIVALLEGSDGPQFSLIEFSDDTIREFTVDVRTDGSVPAFTKGFETAKLFSSRYSELYSQRNEVMANRFAAKGKKTLSDVDKATAMIFDLTEEFQRDQWLVNDDAIETAFWASRQQQEIGARTSATLVSGSTASKDGKSPFKLKAFSKVIESNDE